MFVTVILGLALAAQNNPAAREIPIPTPVVGAGSGPRPSLPAGPNPGGTVSTSHGDCAGTMGGHVGGGSPPHGPLRVVAPPPPTASAPNASASRRTPAPAGAPEAVSTRPQNQT